MESPTSAYREFAPPAALAGQLVCLWAQRIGAGAAPYRHRVLPDACADIVWVDGAAPVVAGPASGVVVLSLPPGALIVGARFRPGVAPCFLGPPADAIRDRELPLSAFWPADAERLWQQIGGERTAAGKLARIEAALLERAQRARPADALALSAAAWLARHPAGQVGTLAKSLGLSERQLHRRIAAAAGYGPKTLQRVLRLQRLLALAGAPRGAEAGLAALAAAAGYADQPHMTRETRALTGLAPATLLPGRASTLALSDLFKTAAGEAA